MSDDNGGQFVGKSEYSFEKFMNNLGADVEQIMGEANEETLMMNFRMPEEADEFGNRLPQ